MRGKRKTKQQNKNSQKHTTNNTKNTMTFPTPNDDYKPICEAIVEANRSIKEEEKKENQKAFEEDHMTKLIVELLNILFTFALIMLGIFTIGSVVFSFVDAFASENNIEKIVCVSCWLVFIVGVLILILAKRKKKQGKLSNKNWWSFIVYAIFVLIIGSFVVAYFSNQLVFFTMSFTLVLTMMFSFCYLAMQSLKRENDRTYLVSYFSAITGMAALVVSALALVITLVQNN